MIFPPSMMRAKLEPARNTYANRFDPVVIPGLAVSYEFQRQLVKALHASGVPILAGTDASWLGVPGFCLLDEIEIFQDLGFTPYEAIQTATADQGRHISSHQASRPRPVVGDGGAAPATGERGSAVLGALDRIGCGYLLLDERRRVVEANATARTILEQRSPGLRTLDDLTRAFRRLSRVSAAR